MALDLFSIDIHLKGSIINLQGATAMTGKPMPKGWSRAMEEEGSSSKLVSPFLRGKRESKLNKENDNESEEASTIVARKKAEEVKKGENGDAEKKQDTGMQFNGNI